MTQKTEDQKNYFSPDTCITPKAIKEKLNIPHHEQFRRLAKRFGLHPSVVLTEQSGGKGAKYTPKAASKFVDDVRHYKETGENDKISILEVKIQMETNIEFTNKRLQKLKEGIQLLNDNEALTAQKLFDLENLPERIKQQGEHYTHLIAKQQEIINEQATIIERLSLAVENNNTQLENLKTFIVNSGTHLQTETAAIGAKQSATPVTPNSKPKDFIKC